jgi:hypothetical protein
MYATAALRRCTGALGDRDMGKWWAWVLLAAHLVTRKVGLCSMAQHESCNVYVTQQSVL